jgi:hypothetical protein
MIGLGLVKGVGFVAAHVNSKVQNTGAQLLIFAVL